MPLAVLPRNLIGTVWVSKRIEKSHITKCSIIRTKTLYLDSSFFTGGGDPLAVRAEFEAVDLLAVALVGEDAA